jgi:membrane protein insertase Oxa1/YidC/SpoIIIJ
MTPGMRKVFLYVIPPFGGLIMTNWPAALQMTFCIAAIISLIQSSLLRQPWFRNSLGLQPIPPRSDTGKSDNSAYTGTMTRYRPPGDASEQRKGGIILDVKNNLSKFYQESKKKVEERKQPKKTGRRTTAELKYAKEYDARRKRELEQEAEARRLEREERLSGRSQE